MYFSLFDIPGSEEYLWFLPNPLKSAEISLNNLLTDRLCRLEPDTDPIMHTPEYVSVVAHKCPQFPFVTSSLRHSYDDM